MMCFRHILLGGGPWSRSRTCWRDYISDDELKEAAEERDGGMIITVQIKRGFNTTSNKRYKSR